MAGCIPLLVHLLHNNEELSKVTTATTPPPPASPLIPINTNPPITSPSQINLHYQYPSDCYNNQSIDPYSADSNVFLDLPSQPCTTTTPSTDTAYSSNQCNSPKQKKYQNQNNCNQNDDPLGRYFIIRGRVSAALRNIINVHCEDQRGKQEMRVLRLLEQIRDYSDHIRASHYDKNNSNNNHYYPYNGSSALTGLNYYEASELGRFGVFDGGCLDVTSLRLGVQMPLAAVTALMKLTFDEEHRHAVCTLGLFPSF